jgi:hypothetical protein
LDEYIESGMEIHPCSVMLGKTISKKSNEILLKNAGICIFGSANQLDGVCENFKKTLEFESLNAVSIDILKRYTQKNKLGDHTMDIANKRDFKLNIKKFGLDLKYTLTGKKIDGGKIGFSFGKMNIRETPIISALRELNEEFRINLDEQLFVENHFVLYEDDQRIMYGLDITNLNCDIGFDNDDVNIY